MKTILFQLTILFMFPVFLAAQWSTDPGVNNPINTMPGEGAIPKIATCTNGDSYIASFSSEGGNYNVRMQRLDPQGYELWATNGILISDHLQMSWLTDWDMTADNNNHAILTFMDIRNGGNNNVVAYRIAPDGSFVWGADGIALSNSTAFDASPKVTATDAGNAVFAWQADDVIIMQKISPAGSLLWGEEGIVLSCSDTYSWPQLLPVGNDEVILKYFHDTGPTWAPTRHVYAQKYDAAGTPVWSSPVAISAAGGISAWTQIFPFINDGNDGFYVAWHDDRDNNMLASTFVQHISSTGSVLFEANGVEASTMPDRNHFYPQLAFPPGSSDLFVYWNEMDGDQNQRGIYGQKISSSGTRLWTDNGKSFIELSSTNVYPVAARHTPTDMIVVYDEYIGAINTHIKAMRIDIDGEFVWDPNIAMICSVNSEKVHPVVNHFNNNQWIISWEDNRNGGNRDIYAQNIQLNGELGPYINQNGAIEGSVDFFNGSVNATEVTVTAGSQSVHPEPNGYYFMELPPGTYTVYASHPYTLTDSIPGILVVNGMITNNVDFSLEVVYADLICKAFDQYLSILNGVDVEVSGPDSTFSGYIENDSIIFPLLPYGNYVGEAWYDGLGPVYAETILGENDQYMEFIFIIGGLTDGTDQPEFGLKANPNPCQGISDIRYRIPVGSRQSAVGSHVTLYVYNIHGQEIRTLVNEEQAAGEYSVRFDAADLLDGIYFLRLQAGDRIETVKMVLLR